MGRWANEPRDELWESKPLHECAGQEASAAAARQPREEAPAASPSQKGELGLLLIN